MPIRVPAAAGERIAMFYDLRDDSQWTAAREARRAWGQERSVIHTLDNDHIVIEFLPGGAREIRP